MKYDVKAIPRYAMLSMLLEVTCRTKPGNVDRGHDFGDLTLQMFAASAVSTLPAWELACRPDAGLGEVIHRAAVESQRWQGGGNTHTGTMLLFAPIARAFFLGGDRWETMLGEVLGSTTVEDAALLYRSLDISGARLAPPGKGEPDAADADAIDELSRKGLNIMDVMKMAESRDLIAAEWCRGFPLSRQAAGDLSGRLGKVGPDAAVTGTFMELLSRQPDTLVTVKHGQEVARGVMDGVADVLAGHRDIDEFDADLHSRKINPGTTADLTAAACFITLFEEGPGWI